ncbi:MULTISPECIES: hypothetical protein [unclassified Modestobacter]|uniref:hypothetical protein n=1 Tax=unclassified Modestobacter TaxID=2643866 RepID=UPI0022AB2BBF|nr:MULTISPECIES: hypothetical protein [unclassified Modestobacter]MCZ2824200.1 hypothetical protein [Modestobacter sp. VKM Ac-2981]MCZ2854272.1 hypothetical protein [Modestobacter sp. VKM Ac-2982]
MDIHRLGRATARGTAVAAVWGIASAALTRLLMRAIALVTDGATEFSWVGTVGITVFYVVVLLPGAIALAYEPGRLASVLFAAGVAFLAFEVLAIGISDVAAHAEGLTPWRWAGVAALAVAMVAVYAAHVTLVHRGAVRTIHTVST